MIDGIWAQRTSVVARTIVVGLYPDVVAPSAVAAADAFLVDESRPPALRRVVAEGRDGVQRALRARERDTASGRGAVL
jgi:aminopeptidase N